MEEEYDEAFVKLSVDARSWSPVEPAGLSQNGEQGDLEASNFHLPPAENVYQLLAQLLTHS